MGPKCPRHRLSFPNLRKRIRDANELARISERDDARRTKQHFANAPGAGLRSRKQCLRCFSVTTLCSQHIRERRERAGTAAARDCHSRMDLAGSGVAS
jgi:hypothetical protein